MTQRPFRSVLVPLTLATFASAQVTVGPVGSGAAHHDIQAGIDAAPPGGVVLVAEGTYAAPATFWRDIAGAPVLAQPCR